MSPNDSVYWLALIVGNTRLHWGYFREERLLANWHTKPVDQVEMAELHSAKFTASSWSALSPVSDEFQPVPISNLPTEKLAGDALWIASVVPEEFQRWQAAGTDGGVGCVEIVRSRLPLKNLYSTIGIDRALSLLGAGDRIGWPMLVIDGGTALTFTAGVASSGREATGNLGMLYGGAILPGMRLQRQSITQGTAVLGDLMPDDVQQMPERWAVNSQGAIASGLTYGLRATLQDYVQDWIQHFPNGKVVLTGGDAAHLAWLLNKATPELRSRVTLDYRLMYWGIIAYRRELTVLE